MRMDCRPGCGACCIAPSISPCAALPNGKLAGEVCPHLTAERRCALFGKPERPAACSGLRPAPEMCGATPDEAMRTLLMWEDLTAPRRVR